MARIDLEAIQAKIDSQSLTLSDQKHSATTGNYDSEQRRLVNWFFASMRTQWGAGKYNSQFGEGEDVNFAKRHWAPRILKHTPEQLADMLQQADTQRINGNEKFTWPDPAMILSLYSNAWERRAHKPYVPPERAIEDISAKERRIEVAQAQLASMKKQDFSDRPKRFQPKDWDARMRAEEEWFKSYCKKLQTEAGRRYPNDSDMASELFSQWRETALNHYWRAA